MECLTQAKFIDLLIHKMLSFMPCLHHSSPDTLIPIVRFLSPAHLAPSLHPSGCSSLIGGTSELALTFSLPLSSSPAHLYSLTRSPSFTSTFIRVITVSSPVEWSSLSLSSTCKQVEIYIPLRLQLSRFVSHSISPLFLLSPRAKQ